MLFEKYLYIMQTNEMLEIQLAYVLNEIPSNVLQKMQKENIIIFVSVDLEHTLWLDDEWSKAADC